MRQLSVPLDNGEQMIRKVLSEKVHLYVMFAMSAVLFWVAFNQYFVGDDFYWLYNAEYAMNHVAGWYDSFFVMNYSGFYRPVTQNIYFFIMFHLFGMNPYPYHLISFAVYLATGLFVYKTIKYMNGNMQASLAGTAFFLFSNVNYAGLSWLSAFSQTGSSFLFIAALYSYVTDRKMLSYFLYGLCLMSGEITSTIPAVVFLYEIVINRSCIYDSIKNTIVLWLTFIGYIMLRFFVIGISASGYFRPSLGVGHVLSLLMKSLILLFGWTKQLSSSLVYSGWNDVAWLSGLFLVAVVLSSLIILAINRQKLYVVGFGILFMLISMLPVLIFTQNNFARYTLAIPLIGLSISLAGLLSSFRSDKNINILSFVFVSALFLLSLCSIYNPAGNNYQQGQNIAGQVALFFRDSIASCEMVRGDFNAIYVVDENRSIIPWMLGNQSEARLVTQRDINTRYVGTLLKQNKLPEVVIGSQGNELVTCGK